ncbi:hypothetical protein AA101099_1793 [Neoasaia chiangmaiensis NBRC 101099]|nr:hypothetical protein [Neoasaia chiangmaiensis]GBR39732.1 hypothetical protein AA101099_1793 [Neoasaia chiangmaiensis NBRC 101099]GEN14716.1 hypothetical protein NCH01_11470 [Neoasaia chiangmaiensis]
MRYVAITAIVIAVLACVTVLALNGQQPFAKDLGGYALGLLFLMIILGWL